MYEARRFVHLPSPAMVVAFVALFVALGGTKNGAVHRSDLARSAVDSSKVANNTLLARDFKAGQLPMGPQGLQGPPGPKGDPGATHLVVRTSSGHGTQLTYCQPGEVATGGGGHSPDGYVVASIPASHPLASFAPNGQPTQYNAPTSWEARALKVNVDTDTGTVTSVEDADVTTWVVCASP